MPAQGPFPLRTVLVPAERHAHALRRDLLASGRGRALAGARFVGTLTLAWEILRQAGRDLLAGEEPLRPARLLALLGEDLGLEYFDLGLLRRTPGWPEAFAAAIGDLEGAGLSPDRLPAGTAQWRDVALLWRRLDAAAGESRTAARLHAEASVLLRQGVRPETGPVLAAVTGRETAAQAAFVLALPEVTVALVVARPLRERHLERVGALYGPAARAALAQAPLPAGGPAERDLLARHLFATPEVLADGTRPRSRGPDGTVHLEEHAGVEAEVEAAAEWVAREVLERRTPLQAIAVLCPVHDPLAALVAARLARLPWKGGPFPVHVAGGLPAAASAGGARALSLVRALAAFLPAEAMAGLLPALRAPRGERTHLTHAEATQLAWSLGTVGGNAAEPALALAWSRRAADRAAQLEQALAHLARDPAAEERRARRVRQGLQALGAVRPALDALVEVARLVVERRPLAAIAPALLAFMEAWLLDPGPGAPVARLLGPALEGARAAAPLGQAVRGTDALSVVEERLLSLRVAGARFGEPAVYVGTVAGAAGLGFQAVRVVGLCEGGLPSAGREDAVLPDAMRAQAHPLLVPLVEDRLLGQLHAFDRAVRGASRAVALSAPRSDLERGEREASSILVEAGAALGRPDGARPGPVPDLRSLQRTSFGPARADAAAFRQAHPVTEVAWQDLAAVRGAVPPRWSAGPHLELARLGQLARPASLGPVDGLLGPGEPFPLLPGLEAGTPISASALERLLGCPLAFLYQRVLGWDEPGGAPSLRELDPLSYGSLFHEVMEDFYRRHGAGFVGRERPMDHWRKLAREIADEHVAALLASYPLVGRGVEERERERLLGDVGRFLEYDARLPLSRFVAVEHPFDGVRLRAGGRALFVRGYVDRLDVEGRHALVRDLKTGRPHPRIGEEEGPVPERDVQLGLYGLVAGERAAEWGLPARLQAAYAYAESGEERAFRDDWGELERATREWLALAARLLSERAFPPTPHLEDCTFCPFALVCGREVPARAAAAAAGAAGPVRDFFQLKGVEQ
jgi:hypothetical protein